MPALRAFREDGTEVMPGDTITMWRDDFIFRAAVQVSNAAGTDGVISVTQEGRRYPHLYAAPFGVIVRDLSDQSEDQETRS